MAAPSIPQHFFSASDLHDFIVAVFAHYQVPTSDAQVAADILIRADLRGIDSHGIARLRAYTRMIEAGRVNPNPNISVVRQTATTATVDGDSGLGLVVGPWANNLVMEKASAYGSGWVSVRNSNHYGIAGYYPMEALKQDLIGWSMTNATPTVAPLWGLDRMLGTNPIAIAFPGKEEPPIVIDMATSAAPFGKIQIALRKQTDVPSGWIMDKDGQLTTRPRDMIEGGALMPLGTTREMGGHKGYALASMVDILCAVLSGANWGPFTPPFVLDQLPPDDAPGKGLGHFFGAMQIAGFIDPDEFKQQIDAWIRTFRANTPAPGTSGPLIPGDPERKAEAERAQNGVPLLQPVVDDLLYVAERTGVDFQVPM
ncbi:MAG: Ldh family oxidoreductase [Bacteroidota bacterium]